MLAKTINLIYQIASDVYWADNPPIGLKKDEAYLQEETHLDMLAQIETVYSIAAEHNLKLGEFNLASYTAKAFQEFINDLRIHTDNAIAETVVLGITQGMRSWQEIAVLLGEIHLAKKACEQVLVRLGMQQASPQDKADIVFRTLQALNGRIDTAEYNKVLVENIEENDIKFSHLEDWLEVKNKNNNVLGYLRKNFTPYDDETDNLAAFFQNIRERRSSIGKCMPLTMLFYLTLLAVGNIQTDICWARISPEKETERVGAHLYSMLDRKEYENTAKDNIPGNLNERMFYKRKIAIEQVLAEAISFNLENLLVVNGKIVTSDSEFILQGISEVETALSWDSQNPYVYEILALAYRRLANRMCSLYQNGEGQQYLDAAKKYLEKERENLQEMLNVYKKNNDTPKSVIDAASKFLSGNQRGLDFLNNQ